MTERSILLIIGGGIAAYKSLELIRELSKRSVKTRAILTAAGAQFVTPLSVGSLTGDKVYSDLFSLTDEAEMGHIELSRSADLVVVAPATADLMAKAANGLANDLASTALLATDKPILMAPAMNVRMWEARATRRNLRTLTEDGVFFIGPNEGEMACGEFGPGRMAEPPEIADAIEAHFARTAGGSLKGRRIIVTAGPTHEPLDPVRYLANRSSGKQGYALAGALARLGGDVALISGPTALAVPPGVTIIRIETAREMLAAVEGALPADCAVMCAAVADYRPAAETKSKIKKERGGIGAIPLTENPDILKTVAQLKQGRPALVVGFAAETDDIMANAEAKRRRKGCDWIVANDVSGDAMGGDENAVTILTPTGAEAVARASKAEIARLLALRIAEALTAPPSSRRAKLRAVKAGE
ncbi:MAG: bifunctional phosphopantothenoylcysteine decarboxylase/phosphopantothenate--cysteine ligase CoaBC [Parvularculaceae bacterium]